MSKSIVDDERDDEFENPPDPEPAAAVTAPAVTPSTSDAAGIAWDPPALTEPPEFGYLDGELVVVPARWVHVQAVYSPQQGLIRYGDPFWASAEQLGQDDRLIPWDDGFVPDLDQLAISRLEG